MADQSWWLKRDRLNEKYLFIRADAHHVDFPKSRRDITVVFTDIQMPGSMDGLKLARAIRGRWPPIKIIATSGHLHLEQGDLPEGGRFLPKPYGADYLLKHVQSSPH